MIASASATAAGLGQADRVQTVGLKCRPRRIESARQLRGLHCRGDARLGIGGHQRGGRARRQRRRPLRVGLRHTQQRVDDGVGMGHAVHDDQRMNALAAHLEGAIGRGGLVEGLGGEAPAFDFVRALRRTLRTTGRRSVGFAGLLPLGGAGPMRRHALGRRPLRHQMGRDAMVQQARDRSRHRCAGRLEDQVMREGPVADDLGGLEFAPGLGNVQRMRLEHRRRQLGAEVRAGQRGHPRQAQRRARELRQPPLDQRRPP